MNNEKHRIALFSTQEEAIDQLERISRCIIANPLALVRFGG